MGPRWWERLEPGESMNSTSEEALFFAFIWPRSPRCGNPVTSKPTWRLEATWPRDRQDSGREESQAKGLGSSNSPVGGGAGRGVRRGQERTQREDRCVRSEKRKQTLGKKILSAFPETCVLYLDYVTVLFLRIWFFSEIISFCFSLLFGVTIYI